VSNIEVGDLSFFVGIRPSAMKQRPLLIEIHVISAPWRSVSFGQDATIANGIDISGESDRKFPVDIGESAALIARQTPGKRVGRPATVAISDNVDIR